MIAQCTLLRRRSPPPVQGHRQCPFIIGTLGAGGGGAEEVATRQCLLGRTESFANIRDSDSTGLEAVTATAFIYPIFCFYRRLRAEDELNGRIGVVHPAQLLDSRNVVIKKLELSPRALDNR
jgi:hypothetical protein